MLKISWFKFTLLNSILITLLNFKLFIYVDSLLSDSLLSIAFLGIYFFTILAIFSLIFVRFLTKFFSIIFISISCISLYFNYFYGTLIDVEMIRNVFGTDVKEVRDLLNYKLIFGILSLLLVIFIIIKTKIVYAPFKTHFKIKILSILISLFLALAIFIPLTKTFIPFYRSHNEIRMYNAPFYPIYSLFRFLQSKYGTKKEFKIIAKDAFLEDNSTKKLLVLVVGETARAANYSLNGYAKNDTNFYTKKEGVVFFNDFSSCGTATAVSLPCMFSFSKRQNYSSSEFSENAMDILQKVGINTAWIDNNSGGCKGVCDRLLDKKQLSSDYDENLLPHLKERLANLSTQNIIILHLQGSHGPTYYKRYSDTFKRFKPTCDTNELSKCDNEALINTYDNTLLYTDFILSEIIKLLKEKSDYQSSLIYLSDHGESLGENGIYLHGMPYAIAPSTQTHIPAIFWSNDENLMNLALKHKSLKLSQDNLFSTLLGYFDVSSSVYEADYDLLNKALKANK